LKLILTARRVEALQKLKEEIRKEVGEGVKVAVVKLDVSSRGEVEGLFGDGSGSGKGGLPEGFGEVDVLVNNA